MDIKNTSPHILNASSNLLGICFVVLTSIKFFKIQQETLVDEFTIATMTLLMVSCILSFLSLKTNSPVRSGRYERIADNCFFISLLTLFVTTMLITFNVIK